MYRTTFILRMNHLVRLTLAPPLLEATAMLHSMERMRRPTKQTDAKTQVSWSEFIRS